MARTSNKAKRSEKPLTSWTRFHLPRDQEWPTWSVDHSDIHVGPLKGVEGWRTASLGRMVDDPEQAAYIILKNFQFSPACAEFLQNLPEHNDSQDPVEPGSTSGNLNLTDVSSSSAPATLRFLILEHVTPAVTAEVEGRVTLTAFLVPRKVDNVFLMWKEKFESVFAGFIPRGYESITSHPDFMFRYAAVWLWALLEDRWVEKKFGKLERTQNEGQTILCHFHLWPRKWGATPEIEEALAADPQSRESWNRAVEQVMPPATSWVQERWDIQDVPRPPEPEFDSEELSEYDEEQERRMKLFFEARGLEKAESSE
ncbi:hypothetical protein LZ30DRAFT_129041 [Colletotrichum cereale]|nr:hypothetical protein LZ30DRAFT_129041 [Colletotrichum cereale]